jgi:hypothetical protein
VENQCRFEATQKMKINNETKVMKKPPPKIRGGVQANGSNSRQLVVPTPRQQLRTTKSKPTKRFEKQKTRQLAKRNWRVFKDFWWVVYHDLLFVGNGAAGIVVKRHDEIIQIALLLVVIFLKHHINASPLPGR